MFENGTFWALLGAALAVGLAGIGSAIGVSRAAQAADGVLAQDSEKFGKVLVLTLLPATQGLYGMIIAFLVLLNLNVLGGNVTQLTVASGLNVFVLCLPIAIGGLVSAIMQGNVATSGVMLVGKKGDQSGRAMTMTVLVEIFAIFALLISILGILQSGLYVPMA